MNLIGKGKVHEEAMQVFSCFPGDDIEFLYGCRICGQVSEATFTVPHPRMGSIKILAACPRCKAPGMLVLGPVEEN